MNDDQDNLDRELRALFSVDPSPDLQARIRHRTTQAPVRSFPFSWRWMIPGFAVASALIALVLFRGAPVQVAPSTPVTAEIVRSELASPPQSPPSTVEPAKPARQETIPAEQPRRTQTQLELLGALSAMTIVPAASVSSPGPGRIELSPMKLLELTTTLAPVPQAAPLRPIELEPLNLRLGD